MHEASIQIQNQYGLHARPAAEFVKLANTFRAEIRVRKDELEVNGKSIMGVMMLAAEYGCEITIQAKGEDAEPALEQLAALVQRRFGED
ncbi:MAG: HPr family phosphocarrier protein [Longimicrobiales bacterium]